MLRAGVMPEQIYENARARSCSMLVACVSINLFFFVSQQSHLTQSQLFLGAKWEGGGKDEVMEQVFSR